MAYRFNNGRGGVTCDQCQILFDADLSFKEYEAIYCVTGHDGDFCWKCKTGFKEKGVKHMREITECKNCGASEWDAEGNCIYCKCNTGDKKI